MRQALTRSLAPACCPSPSPSLPAPQFVIQQVAGEVQQVAAGKAATIGGLQVGHVAHLAGAAAGVVLVALISRLPDPAE